MRSPTKSCWTTTKVKRCSKVFCMQIQLCKALAADDVTVNASIDNGISKASIHWRPSQVQKQSEMSDGQFVVLYDVEREEDTGQIQV